MNLRELFLSLDLFAVKTELIFLGRRKHPSYLGILMTVLACGITLGLFIDFSSNMVEKQNPIISSTNLYNPIPKRIEIDIQSFKLIVGMMSFPDLSFILDPRVFKISFHLVAKTTENDKVYYNASRLNVRPCTKEDLNVFGSGTFYTSGNESNYLCQGVTEKDYSDFYDSFYEDFGIEDNASIQNGTFYLEGDVSTRTTVYINMKIMICRNKTSSNISCRPQNEIERLLNNLIFVYGISSNSYDLRNYSTPFSPIIHTSFLKQSFDQTQSTQFFLKKIKLVSDDGYLLKSKNEIEFTQAKDPILNTRTRRDSVLFETIIMVDKNEEIFYRNYDKIQDVLARITSLTRIFIFFISTAFNKLLLRNYYLSFFDKINRPPKENPLGVIDKKQDLFVSAEKKEKNSHGKKKRKVCSLRRKKGIIKTNPPPEIKKTDYAKKYHDLFEFFIQFQHIQEFVKWKNKGKLKKQAVAKFLKESPQNQKKIENAEFDLPDPLSISQLSVSDERKNQNAFEYMNSKLKLPSLLENK